MSWSTASRLLQTDTCFHAAFCANRRRNFAARISFLSPSADGRDLSELRTELRRYNGHAEFVECAHKPLHLEEIFTHEVVPLSFLKELRIGMISGIAKPESFEEGLRKLGVELIYSRRFADHHRFSENEIAKMFERR